MASIDLRFVPIFLAKYNRIKTAQIARKAHVEKGNYKEKLKSMVALLAPLMMSAFRTAD